MEIDRRNQLSVHCPHCDAPFPAAKSMRGGFANCPHCDRAVQVTGDFEPLFWILFSLGALFVLLMSGMFFAFGGPAAGLVTLLIGVAILTIILVAL